MISLSNLTKTYSRGAKPAVDHLDLFVNDGEIFGFIGPNGAGKSTTIKMITGIIPPDSGSIYINGEDMIQNPVEAKLMMGYVPDSPDLYERLSGLEYLTFMAVYTASLQSKGKSRSASTSEMFEMQEALASRIKSYSHGMRQKIVIMGALIHSPGVGIGRAHGRP